MKTWKDVESHARSERTRAENLARKGARTISEFYPEIRANPTTREFTNTLGSALIPDLLTSAGVIVDLYDWADPSKLIQVYGVDLPFLDALRERQLVVTCANLEPERYKGREWLYPLLTDERTLFRSIRTPKFFATIDPGYAARQLATRTALTRSLTGLDSSTQAAIVVATKAAHPPESVDEAANPLSQWLERLSAYVGEEEVGELRERIGRGDAAAVGELRRWHRLAASPCSAALDGEVKVLHGKWQDLFSGSCLVDGPYPERQRFEGILSWLAEERLGATTDDFHSERFWHALTAAQRNRLLDELSNAETRHAMLEAEGLLRAQLATETAALPERDQIRDYVAKAKRHLKYIRQTTGVGVVMLGAGFGCYASGFWGAAMFGGASFLAESYLATPLSQRLVERFAPRFRLVRLLSDDAA